MKKFKAMAVAALAVASTMTAMAESNPFLEPYTSKYEIPPFEQIKTSDFIPAIKAGIEQQEQNLANILRNRATPDFDNTIVPLENLSPILERVGSVFYHYDSCMKTPEFAEMSEEAIPLLNEAQNKVMLNQQLFDRIKSIYDMRDKMGLTPVQKRLVEKYYRQFAEQGAALSPEKKEQLVKINDELSKLFIQFNKNLLNATNDFFVTVYDKADLAGLPDNVVAAAAEEASARGLDGLWVFTLRAPSRLPVLESADNRGLREAIYKGYTNLASYGANSNYPVIEKIVKLRAEKAKLMGFDNFAQMQTAKVMAKTPEAAESLLLQVFEPAVKRSQEEVADMQAYVDANGGGFKIAPWDYYYYAGKVKEQKFGLSDADIQPYFSLENVKNGLFYCAEKLYGIKLVEMPDAPKYMDEVTVYDVQDAKTGEHISVFMTDFFPRSTKVQGAWMEQMQSAGMYENGVMKRPIVYNVCNFSRPAGDVPALLTLDEVETMFHEFGHALQGMLGQSKYKTLAGTNVDRDCVELPSQLNEHWATSPEVLRYYAKHYKTGEPMSEEMIQKIQDAAKFNQGFITTELAGAALLDLAWGANDGENVDVPGFEAAFAEKIGLPEEITYRYRSPYFKHIFGDDGYASGYYTYLWAQVLEADAWELFKQKGIFDKKTAEVYKKNILESGDDKDATELFKNFRGHAPDAKALLRLRGFEDAPKKSKDINVYKDKK
ncbi:MAG: M3 family metallopeptidase [Muribaculaceae bacterium]|nr:M3 family metallopeptidase [Muribaculaceae bacterium]